MNIALTISVLNDLDILACDIKGDYLNAECRKIFYTISGSEFGSEEGVIMIVNMALYRMKSSGVSFRAKLVKVLHGLNYRTTKSNPGVWLRAGTKDNGTNYWEMTLCYVDNVLVISKHPKHTIEGLNMKFILKGDTVKSSTMYLRENPNIVENESGSKCVTMSSKDYVNMAVQNV